MRALMLLCINVPTFDNYKDMIGAKFKKTGHVTLTTPLLGMVWHHRLEFGTVYLLAKFDYSSFSHSRDITEGVKT